MLGRQALMYAASIPHMTSAGADLTSNFILQSFAPEAPTSECRAATRDAAQPPTAAATAAQLLRLRHWALQHLRATGAWTTLRDTIGRSRAFFRSCWLATHPPCSHSFHLPDDIIGIRIIVIDHGCPIMRAGMPSLLITQAGW